MIQEGSQSDLKAPILAFSLTGYKDLNCASQDDWLEIHHG